MTPEPAGSRRAFSGRFVSVDVERWDGREREVVVRPEVVGIVAEDPRGSVVLVRQFRPAVRCDLLEIPAGLVDSGEEPLGTARRELREETGLRGGTWQAGPTVLTTPGFARERVHLFFASDLEEGPAAPDEGETLEVVRWPLATVRERLAEIEDAKTLIGLLLHLCAREGVD